MNINKEKVLNVVLNQKLESKKFPKTFFEVIERQNMKNKAIFELYTDDDNKSKYSSNPMNILKSAQKKIKLSTKCISRAATTEFVWKIRNIKKYLMNTLIFVRLKYLKMKS